MRVTVAKCDFYMSRTFQKMAQHVFVRNNIKCLISVRLSNSFQIEAASGRQFTNRQIAEEAVKCASALRRNGLKKGDVVATCFNELGAKKGVGIFKKVAKTRAALQEAVDNKWGKMIRDQVAEWTMTSGNPDIDGKKATDFLKEHTTNKSVVGISAVFYAMSGTKPIKDAAEAAELPRIPQPKLLDSLKKKLKDILTLSGPNGTGDFEYVEESV